MLNALFTECFLSKSDVRKLGRHGVKIIEASGNLDESKIIKKLKDIDIYIYILLEVQIRLQRML